MGATTPVAFFLMTTSSRASTIKFISKGMAYLVFNSYSCVQWFKSKFFKLEKMSFEIVFPQFYSFITKIVLDFHDFAIHECFLIPNIHELQGPLVDQRIFASMEF